MTTNPKSTIEYLISLPEDRVVEIEEALLSRGIYFDRRKHIVAINEAFRDHTSMAIGSQLPSLIRAVNRFLEHEGLKPLVPENHQEWEPQRYYRFMQFAIVQFSWNGDEVDDAWWRDEGLAWRDVVTANKDLFQAVGRKR